MTNLLGRLGTQRRRRVRSRAADEMLASERRVRFQAALAECASALLASSGEDQLKRALEALLNATDASYVFIERNVIDPDLGFCSQSVIEAARPTAALEPSDSEYWDLVPWDRMPTSRSYLERGEPFVIIPDELDGVEYQQYAADPWPFKSELNIPIHVHGEWA